MKIYKILGKRGRITIPYAIRQELDIEQDDVISFEQQEDGSVVIRAEPRCCRCREEKQSNEISLQEILAGLPTNLKREALVYLSLQLALERRNNGDVR